MARTKLSIAEQITAKENEIASLTEQLKNAKNELKELNEKKKYENSQIILDALEKSGKNLDEVLSFIQG